LPLTSLRKFHPLSAHSPHSLISALPDFPQSIFIDYSAVDFFIDFFAVDFFIDFSADDFYLLFRFQKNSLALNPYFPLPCRAIISKYYPYSKPEQPAAHLPKNC